MITVNENLAENSYYFQKVKYISSSKKCSFDMTENQSIKFLSALAMIFGMSPQQNPFTVKDGNGLWKDKQVADINTSLHSLLVYCDLLQCMNMGDTKAPLLLTLYSRDKWTKWEIIHKTLQKKIFDTIEILIKDDLGLPVLY